MSLARFLRSHLHLTGTKIMCGQAGCGACVVKAKFNNPATGQMVTKSINSVISWIILFTRLPLYYSRFDPVTTEPFASFSFADPYSLLVSDFCLVHHPRHEVRRLGDRDN